MEPIPTWKVLAPMAIPVFAFGYLFLSGAIALGPVKGGWEQFFGGLYFITAGLWAGAVAYLWPRLTDGFRSRWRPASRATPVLFAVVFTCLGIGLALKADTSAPLHVPGPTELLSD